MKRYVAILLTALLLFGSAFGLFACKGNKTKLPTTNYEKVCFAFNGVESSLQTISATSKKMGTSSNTKLLAVSNLLPTALFAATSQEDALSTIDGLFTSGDNIGSDLSDLS